MPEKLSDGNWASAPTPFQTEATEQKPKTKKTKKPPTYYHTNCPICSSSITFVPDDPVTGICRCGQVVLRAASNANGYDILCSTFFGWAVLEEKAKNVKKT